MTKTMTKMVLFVTVGVLLFNLKEDKTVLNQKVLLEKRLENTSCEITSARFSPAEKTFPFVTFPYGEEEIT